MTDSASSYRCPLCSATTSKLAYRFAEGSYVRCTHCQLLSLYPLPNADSLLDLYDASYYGGSSTEAPNAGDRESDVHCVGARERPHASAKTEGYGAYAEQRTARSLSFQRYAASMARQHPGARVLDVGCALGYFLKVALEHGLDAYGVDASEAAILQIRPEFGSRVRHGTLADIPDTEHGTYDYVFASDLIEHVPEPRGFVAEVARLLKPGAKFWGITPNTASLLAKLSRQHWVSFKPPEHVILYDKEQIRRLLAPHFTLVKVSTALQEYPAALVAERLGQLLGPLGTLATRAGSALGSRALRVPDGNMFVQATKR